MANLDNSLEFLATMAKLTVADPVTADDNADKSINKYLAQLFSNDTYLKENAVANAWKPNTDYAAGDVAFSRNARSYMRFDCIVAGTSGAAEPDWNAAGTGAAVIDGTCRWIIHDVKDTLPVGAIIPFPMAAVPPGYLVCNGQAVGRATYPELYAAIGTAYGAGDGSTTFNLPNLQDRFPLGKGTTYSTLGATGGETAHVLTIAEMPSHWHGYGTNNNTGAGSAGTRGGDTGNIYHTQQTDYTGGGAAHNNMPPYITLLYCIKAFGATQNPGMVDITELANEVAGKMPLTDFIGTNQSKTANGWQKLPGGLILQWGAYALPGQQQTIAFPIAFPTACLMVTGDVLSSATVYYLAAINNKTTTGCQLTTNTASAQTINILAIGY